MASDRQANLEQTLTSVISLLETEQTLKKVRIPAFLDVAQSDQADNT